MKPITWDALRMKPGCEDVPCAIINSWYSQPSERFSKGWVMVKKPNDMIWTEEPILFKEISDTYNTGKIYFISRTPADELIMCATFGVLGVLMNVLLVKDYFEIDLEHMEKSKALYETCKIGDLFCKDSTVTENSWASNYSSITVIDKNCVSAQVIATRKNCDNVSTDKIPWSLLVDLKRL
jgi:hypothetical protein